VRYKQSLYFSLVPTLDYCHVIAWFCTTINSTSIGNKKSISSAYTSFGSTGTIHTKYSTVGTSYDELALGTTPEYKVVVGTTQEYKW